MNGSGKQRVLGTCVLMVVLLGIGARIWAAADGSTQWPYVVFGIGTLVIVLLVVSFVAWVDERPVRAVLRDATKESVRGVHAATGRLRQWFREAIAPHRRR